MKKILRISLFFILSIITLTASAQSIEKVRSHLDICSNPGAANSITTCVQEKCGTLSQLGLQSNNSNPNDNRSDLVAKLPDIFNTINYIYNSDAAHIYGISESEMSAIEQCFNNSSCRDINSQIYSSGGCVENYKVALSGCEMQKKQLLEKPKSIPESKDWCVLVEKNIKNISAFFNHDAKACSQQLESPTVRTIQLFSLQSKLSALGYDSTIETESIARSSCQELRKFMNYCVYVTGSLKGNVPSSETETKFPSSENYLLSSRLNFDSSCFNTSNPNIPENKIVMLATAYSSNSAKPDFKALLEKLRARPDKPEDQSFYKVACNNITTKFNTLNCTKFENTISNESSDQQSTFNKKSNNTSKSTR